MNKVQIMIATVLLSSSVLVASNVVSIQTTGTVSGDSGTFSIIMKNNVPVNGLHFTLQYESDIITPIRITPINRAGALSGSTASLSDANKINFLVYDLGYNFAAVDSGTIFEVDYLVRDSILTSTISHLVFTEAMAADSNITNLIFEFIGGEIVISPQLSVKETSESLPKAFELHQNYPNPFNPTSSIRFDVPVATLADLRIFNILGQLVMTVFENKSFTPGRHETRFDASGLASGIYFYRLDAKSLAGPPRSFHGVGKMILVR